MANLTKIIDDAARARGFAMVGFARLHPLDARDKFFADWLADGRQGTMQYLAREPGRRIDPRVLDPRFQSVISLAYPYAAVRAPEIDWRAELRGRMAAYALGPDYHDYVLAAAKSVAATLVAQRPDSITRTYVDTGPVFEREWASQAGLGWFGRNTMLLNREHGSYFFLAEIFTDLEIDAPAAPYRDHCGTCRRCVDLCPTGALEDGYKLEPRVCISYLTIEHRGAIARELRPKLGQWIFGCDICNDVCPWNAPENDNDQLSALPFLPDVLALDDAAFSRRFSGSAIKRAKRRGLLRNAAIVLGNTGNRDAVPALARTLEYESEPIVRAHAAWALGNLGGTAAQSALERASRRETLPEVVQEITLAIGEIESQALVKARAPLETRK
ncbi:MAG TPA: tRNA epoxyqueuosine(34) reductase QueG [Candidatus Binataceae bacterium]|nr:tRNA epoxyqueuosine(34) reductase QueG [Candidatus Binataceae bacterium]